MTAVLPGKSAPSPTAELDTAQFSAWLASRAEPTWLSSLRQDAFNRLRQLPWPTLRDEEWRRTDIRLLKIKDFLAAIEQPAAEPHATDFLDEAWNNLSAHYATGLAHSDGLAVRSADSAKLPPGVVFLPLAEAIRSHGGLVQRHLLNKAVDPEVDVFSALHSAYWTGGTFLYVPRGVVIEQPLFTLVGLSATGKTDLHHTLVVLEDGAEATLVQEFSSPTRQSAGLHAGAVELLVGANAKLRYVNIQNWDANVWHFSRERAIVDRDASIQWTIGGLGGRLAKVNQEVALAGQGANAQVNGVIFTSGRQNLTYLTRQDHQAPHTTSDLLYKAGLKDSSRVVWKGMIRVEPDAQRTNAYQKNDNLMLDERARADSIPGLEIEANDVRCTHGATAGRVDEEMVFYLQSRGISREEATRLIVEGFFANVYDRISVEPVRETLRRAVADKLASGSAAQPPRPGSPSSA